MIKTQYLKLSDLTKKIEEVINDSFSGKTYWVVAEIKNLKFYPKKNYYFLDLVEKDQLKDTALTSIKATVWGRSAKLIQQFEYSTGQAFKDDIQVLVRVIVSYHITYGLKVEIIDIDPNFTIGQLEKQKQEILKRLIKEEVAIYEDGELLTFNKSLLFKPVIQNIALVTSENADGFKDFITEIKNNEFGYTFNIDAYFSQLQGEGAEESLLKQFQNIEKSNKQYDAVVIVRGGGSKLDFAAFDCYKLSKSVAEFPIPIITGIGHEKDECIVDLMANLKTKTPTKAAASIIFHNCRFENEILTLKRSIIDNCQKILSDQKFQISLIHSTIIRQTKDCLSHQKYYLSPFIHNIIQKANRMLQSKNSEIEKHSIKIKSDAANLMNQEKLRLQIYQKLFNHVNPENTLKRGFALVYMNGELVKDTSTLPVGGQVKTVFHNAIITSTITEKENRENE